MAHVVTAYMNMACTVESWPAVPCVSHPATTPAAAPLPAAALTECPACCTDYRPLFCLLPNSYGLHNYGPTSYGLRLVMAAVLPAAK